MTNVASTNSPAAKAETSTEMRQIVLKEIGAKWNKFSERGSVRAREQGRCRDPGRGQIRPRQGTGSARRRRADERPSHLTWASQDTPRPPFGAA